METAESVIDSDRLELLRWLHFGELETGMSTSIDCTSGIILDVIATDLRFLLFSGVAIFASVIDNDRRVFCCLLLLTGLAEGRDASSLNLFAIFS